MKATSCRRGAVVYMTLGQVDGGARPQRFNGVRPLRDLDHRQLTGLGGHIGGAVVLHFGKSPLGRANIA